MHKYYIQNKENTHEHFKTIENLKNKYKKYEYKKNHNMHKLGREEKNMK